MKKLISIAILAAIQFALAIGAKANNLSTIPGQGPTTLCGTSRCCILFDFSVTSSTDELDIDLTGGALDTCFDWKCFLSQFGTGVTATHTPVGHIVLTFSPALSSGHVSFVLCPKDGDSTDCMTGYNWTSKISGTANGSGTDTYHTGCESATNPGCGSCDQIQVTGTGTTRHICIYKGSVGGSTSDIQITFTPPLPCKPIASSLPAGWFDVTPGTAPYAFLEIKSVVTALNPCGSLCFDLPLPCGTGDHLYKMQVMSQPSPQPCGDTPAILKPANGSPNEDQGSESNFPNPVSGSNEFKTQIPFSTSSDGTATIRISDQSGKTVLTDSENLLSAGKHFFYFSAKDLPAGTYYYTIEFPKGVIIKHRAILVVK